MRTTENLSLRLDPDLVRLARRSATERELTLREFFEEAIRRHVAALTKPEEQQNLLSAVEQRFLRLMDQRICDMLERVAGLSVKEAIDQAFTVQIVKRLLYMQVGDQNRSKVALDKAWDEAVERVNKRGRPSPPEVVEQLQAKLAQWEQWAKEQKASLSKAQAEKQQAAGEIAKLTREKQELERQLLRLQAQHEQIQAELHREFWVSERLDRQGMNPIGRKSASELRKEYRQEGAG